MPAPDPQAITVEYNESGSVAVFADVFLIGNHKARFRRAKAIFVKLRADDWLCWHCAGPVPLFRRADARYCCEGCRTATAAKGAGSGRQGRGAST